MVEARRVFRAGQTPASLWNIANLITFLRIICTPFFFYLLVAEPTGSTSGSRWLALVLFVLSTVSDGIDGYLARSRNLGTSLGVLLDPIADKVVIGGALIALSVTGELPWWITVVVLLREVGITVYRMAIVHREIHAASWGGKVKTTVQSVAVAFAIAPFPALLGEWFNWVNLVLMVLAVALTVSTGIEYLWKATRR